MEKSLLDREVFVSLLKENKMVCKICSRVDCTECFHNIEEQEEFDALQDHKDGLCGGYDECPYCYGLLDEEE